MSWKRIKIALLIILGLIIIIPAVLYLKAIDLSKSHTARVNSLPLYSSGDNNGEYRIEANDMEFLIRVAGMQNDGPTMVLLHGFPESSIMWKPLLQKASSLGYRVLSFDQRGYSPTARPSGAAAYHIDNLVSDVIAVADKVGFDKFHLVGHDWGAVVSWKTAMDLPERLHSLTTMAIPHIGVFFNAVLNHPEQKKRSAYINQIQTPIIPEFYFQVNKDKFFKRTEGVWTSEEINEYKTIHGEHGATTATMNWYRALDLEKVAADKSFNKMVTIPTLFMWGTQDQVVAPDIIPMQDSLIDAPLQTIALDAGHSLMQLKTDSVLAAIMQHVDKYSIVSAK